MRLLGHIASSDCGDADKYFLVDRNEVLQFWSSVEVAMTCNCNCNGCELKHEPVACKMIWWMQANPKRDLDQKGSGTTLMRANPKRKADATCYCIFSMHLSAMMGSMPMNARKGMRRQGGCRLKACLTYSKWICEDEAKTP